MSDVLKTMPDSLCPYLSVNNRLDLVDFNEAGMKAQVTNAFDRKSELLQLTDRYASLRLSVASQVDLWLLPTADQPVLCMVTTYGTTLRESCLSFFTAQWLPLSAEAYITLPDYPFVATIDAAQQTLTLSSQTAFDSPASEEQEQPKNLQTIFNWKEGRFK
jgi:hypothetical protein